MKYRTTSVRKRQKIAVFSSISALLVSLSVLSSVAVVSSNRATEEFQKTLQSEPEFTPPVAETVDRSEMIWLTGDSVILGIRSAIAEIRPLLVVNARVGRAAPELLEEMTKDFEKAAGSTIVMDLGNNDLLNEETVRAIFDLVKESPKVVVVNTAVPRAYRDANNELITELAAQYSNIRVVDWSAISDGHPEYFAPDGVHLVPTGVSAYVIAIDEALK
jgi:hypothetical protein